MLEIQVFHKLVCRPFEMFRHFDIRHDFGYFARMENKQNRKLLPKLRFCI